MAQIIKERNNMTITKKKLKCRVCGYLTNIVFNINLEAVPICQSCATAITTQEFASWLKEKKL